MTFFLRKEFLNIFSLETKFCSGGLKYKPNELVGYFTNCKIKPLRLFATTKEIPL